MRCARSPRKIFLAGPGRRCRPSRARTLLLCPREPSSPMKRRRRFQARQHQRRKPMQPRVLVLLLLLLVASPFAVAASAPDLSGIAYEQKLGPQIPMRGIFRDDTGRIVRLDDLFEGKPLVLALGYF